MLNKYLKMVITSAIVVSLALTGCKAGSERIVNTADTEGKQEDLPVDDSQDADESEDTDEFEEELEDEDFVDDSDESEDYEDYWDDGDYDEDIEDDYNEEYDDTGDREDIGMSDGEQMVFLGPEGLSSLALIKAREKYDFTDENGTKIATGHRDIVRLSPATDISNVDMTQIFSKLNKSLNSLMDKNKREYESEFNSMKEYYTGDDEAMEIYLPFFMEQEVSITRADSTVLSIAVSNSEFTGGAHPNYGISCYVFDSNSGRELTLSDVIKDKKGLADKIMKAIDPQVDLMVDKDFFVSGVENDTLQFMLDQVGITFYFSPYDIAPYAAGVVTATIPYKGNEQRFNQIYSYTPYKYISPIATGFSYVDIFEGERPYGDVGTLNTYFAHDDEYGNSELIVSIGEVGDSQKAPAADSVQYYYVRTEGVGGYIYAQANFDDDVSKLYIWEVGNDRAGKVTLKFNGIYDFGTMVCPGTFDDTNISYFALLTDTISMPLTEKRDSGWYFVGYDGVPVKR